MKKINIKPNLRQFLTDKIKIQKNNTQDIPISYNNYNFMKQINSNTHSKKNIGKFSLLNSLKGKDTKKLAKLIVNNNLKNIKQTNYNFNYHNNSFLKEIQNDCNNFRKSKTTDKIQGNNVNLLIGYQENQMNNKNKKIMIKQNNMKKLNLNISKIPRCDYSSFKQAMKYYTLKSESQTIQIEELSTYLRPIRNILGLANVNKIKIQNNVNSSVNIHNYFNINEKKQIGNKDKYNSSNSNILYNKENFEEVKKNFNSIVHDEDNIDNNNDMGNNNFYDMTFGKNMNLKNSIHLTKNNIQNENKKISNDIISNLNSINTPLIKNYAFCNNIPYTQRNNKISQIKIDKIDNTNKVITINENNSRKRTSINNIDTTNNNIINSKNISEIDTQISTNNNLNNANQESKSLQSQSQTLYQFRPRKMHLPKNGINLSSMHFKNQILQNILNKRKQKNKS
jgi:hypothetical protein